MNDTITTENGVIYRNSVMVGAIEADKIAKEYGFVYAEQLVKYLEEKVIATKAHFLCIEHEQWRLRNEANNKTG